MLELSTLASGSSGNAALVGTQNTAILVDAGISAKRITTGLAQLGRSAAGLDAICITHSHADHVSGLRVFLKRTECPVYTTEATAEAICVQLPEVEQRIRLIHPAAPVRIGAITVNAFPTLHDAPGSVGYTFTDGERKCSIVTDLGYVTDEVRENIFGSQLALVEANHEPDWVLTGPYPPYLKSRILGDHGHLSNEDSATLCCELAMHGTEKLVLAHLSRENNTPERARTVVCGMLARAGLGLIAVSVAPRQDCAAPIEV